jgi:predicted ATPase
VQQAELLELAGHGAVILSPEQVGPPPRPPAPLRTRIPDPRAAKLVGRTEERGWVCERLKAGDVAAIAGVRGIGGIGKTELAIAAAGELQAHFQGRVIWLDCGARDVRAIQDEMAFALGVELKDDDLLVRRDALALAFEHQPPMLIVLDDVRKRHLGDFAALKPPCPPCALLVTSRRDDLPLPRPAIRRLDVLKPQQSCELLGNLVEPEWLAAEPAASDDLVELLENIPLALTLAARRGQTAGNTVGRTARAAHAGA